MLLRSAVDRLKTALPRTWTLDLDLDPGRDGTVTAVAPDARLTIRTPSGASATFTIEVKRASRGSVRGALERLLLLSDGQPALVITDFANPALRKQCEELGIGYVDLTGWVFIRNDSAGIFVRTQGPARQAPLPDGRTTATKRLDGPGASKVVRALWDVTSTTGVRELAQRAGVSAGTVTKVLPALAAYGAVTRLRDGGVTDVDRRLLMERWTLDYKVYRTNPEVLWRLAPRGPDLAYADLLATDLGNDPTGRTIAYTGWLAATVSLPEGNYPVVPNTLLSIYSADPGALGDDLGLRTASPQTANVVLIRPRDETLLTGVPLPVPEPQIIADLMTMGGRYDELATQLSEATSVRTETP